MMGYGGCGFKTVFQQHHFEQDLYYNSAEIFAEKWKNITEYNLLSVFRFFEIEVKNMKFDDYSEN